LAAVAPDAKAISIPSHESTGSLRERGSLPPSTSEASSSAYNMEGTKKQGISAKKKEAILKEIKASATAAAAPPAQTANNKASGKGK
jgi:hypothetical protein